MSRGRPASRSAVLDRLQAGPIGAPIDRLRPLARDRVSVVVAGATVAALSKDEASRLGLRQGLAWTPEVAARVAPAAELDAAREAANRLLSFRPRTKGELLLRLRRAGVREALAERLVGELERAGKVNDTAFAHAYALEIASKPAGKRLIEAKLRERRVDGPTARRAASAALEGSDPLADATRLAEARVRRLPEKLDAAARARRLLGLLARRGFDGEVARQAVRRALGKAARDLDDG